MSRVEVTPLHLSDFSSPTLSQELSPLFTAIPGELRDRIFDFALCDYEDKSRLYDVETCYKRPDYFAPRKTTTALLRTCQRVYREAWSLPWTNAEHTFWLTEAKRMPPHALARHRLRDALKDIVESVQTRHGTVPTIDQVRIFAQLYILEPGLELGMILEMPNFYPLHITLTLRHTDWWLWEDDEVLHIDAKWVNLCRLPSSVKEFRLELESLERKKLQIDSMAAQMAHSWMFQRTDGVRLAALPPRPQDAKRWTGTSAWNESRWLRDEVRPGQVDYYVLPVVWKPLRDEDAEIEVVEAPNLRASGTAIPRAPNQRVTRSYLRAANIGLDVPTADVISRLAEWAARPRPRVHYARTRDYGEDTPET
jgi:hypothetical protein